MNMCSTNSQFKSYYYQLYVDFKKWGKNVEKIKCEMRKS